MPYIGRNPDKGNFSDLNGAKLILDADADTHITADTDDQIDIQIAGADDFQFTANTFTVLSGSTLTVASGATIVNSGTATGFGSNTPSSADGQALGSTSAEWSDLYLADGGVIYFGADQDVTVTHDPDDGLFLKSKATADDNPFLLTLQTGETDMAADDVIGKIAFQAPDEGTGTDAILVAAAIQARAEGNFSSSNNATSIDFMVGSSEAAATKMTLNSTGNLLIGDGTSSLPSLTNTGDLNTGIYFPAADTVGVVAGGTEKFRFGSNPIPGGTKNLLINGGFNIDQYGGIGNVGDTNYEYFIDGWCTYNGYGSAARYSVIKSTGPEGSYSSSSMQLSVNVAETDTSTATMFAGFMQILEGQNIRGLDWGTSGARATTLSFWIRSPVSGTHCVALSDGHGSGRTCPIEYTIDSADVWQYVSVTFPGDTGGTAIPNDETPSMWVVFPLHTGSSYEGTAGSWQAGEKYGTSNMVNMVGTTSKYVLLTDVQLEIGDVATDFALDDYGTALAKCQRYYYSFDITAGPRFGAGGYDPGNALSSYSGHPVQMRATPTAAFTSSAFRLAHDGAIHDDSITLSISIDKFGYHAQSSHSTSTQGEWYWILNNSGVAGSGNSGDITFDANLP